MNIRYPIYEGVYRILTKHRNKDKIHYRDISQQQQLADDTEYSECCFHAYMIELLTSG